MFGRDVPAPHPVADDLLHNIDAAGKLGLAAYGLNGAFELIHTAQYKHVWNGSQQVVSALLNVCCMVR